VRALEPVDRARHRGSGQAARHGRRPPVRPMGTARRRPRAASRRRCRGSTGVVTIPERPLSVSASLPTNDRFDLVAERPEAGRRARAACDVVVRAARVEGEHAALGRASPCARPSARARRRRRCAAWARPGAGPAGRSPPAPGPARRQGPRRPAARAPSRCGRRDRRRPARTGREPSRARSPRGPAAATSSTHA